MTVYNMDRKLVVELISSHESEPAERIEKFLIHIEEGNLPAIISMNMKEESKDYGINWASGKGQIEVVKYFLSKGANPNKGYKGLGSLSVATEKGSVEVARLLIKHGANVNFGFNGIDMLGRAVYSDKPEMIELAIENGFDINRVDILGFTALMVAAAHSKYNSFRFLLKRGADYRKVAPNPDPLIFGSLPSASQGCLMGKDSRRGLEILLGYIERKEGKRAMVGYINRPSQIGMTILHLACADQQEGAVQLLVKLGADTEVRDSLGRKPVDFVEKGGKSETTQRIKSMLEAARRSSNRSKNK